MNRIDRLELVVRNLADRILGEEYTFDAIAEQEAAEQGVAYVPPPAAPAPPLDLGPILDAIENISGRIAALEQRPAGDGAPAIDLEPIITFCDGLSKRLLDLETEMQGNLQRTADLLDSHAKQLHLITSADVFDLDVKKRKAG